MADKVFTAFAFCMSAGFLYTGSHNFPNCNFDRQLSDTLFGLGWAAIGLAQQFPRISWLFNGIAAFSMTTSFIARMPYVNSGLDPVIPKFKANTGYTP